MYMYCIYTFIHVMQICIEGIFSFMCMEKLNLKIESICIVLITIMK